MARMAVLNQAHADMNRLIPKKTGQLRTESQVNERDSTILYNAKYAKYQYYNKYENYTTPNTGPYWDEKGQRLYGRLWKRTAERAMKR